MSLVVSAFEKLLVRITKNANSQLTYAIVAGAAGGVAGTLAVIVVECLIDAAIEEKNAAATQAKLDQLLGLYYRSGLKWLEEAKNQAKTSVKEKYIEQALIEFVHASQVNLEFPEHAARCEAYIGICHGLLNRPDLANFEISYQRFSAVEKSLMTGTEKKEGILGSAVQSVDCNLAASSAVSRRKTIAMLVSGLAGSKWGSVDTYGKGSQVSELYAQMNPLAKLLRARGSKIPELGVPYSLDFEGFSNRYADAFEKRCGRKLYK